MWAAILLSIGISILIRIAFSNYNLNLTLYQVPEHMWAATLLRGGRTRPVRLPLL